ncbi:MAG: hypothetical protein GQ538_01500 [Xanthomonadales bacterium]|nr:hypothetical protein [Xanthomonadales bacterium]
MAERAYALNPLVCGYNVSCAFNLAGDPERALDLLEELAESGALQIDWLKQDSDWDTVRDHPRYLAIVENSG